jgi:hypothetical protein
MRDATTETISNELTERESKMTTKTYVIVNENSYPTDTAEQIELARTEMKSSGIVQCQIWAGDIDDPDSYESGGFLRSDI